MAEVFVGVLLELVVVEELAALNWEMRVCKLALNWLLAPPSA